VSAIWESSLLTRAGRVTLRRSVLAFFDDLFSNPAYQPLDLTPEHVYVADDLRFTRDPFDALIVASAQIAGLPLVTRDGPIRESGAVAVLW
jgi:PIN domain nuclease of toxin-antitoxin system